MLHNRRVLAAKIETTPGVAETLTAAEGVMNVYDAVIQPEIGFTERRGQTAFSRLRRKKEAKGGTLTFRHRLEPGSAAQPQWVSVLWPACGLVNAANVYTPRTESIGSNVKTVTIGLWEDGLLKSLVGAMGSMKFMFTAGMIPEVEFTFRGLWATPIDSTNVAPTYPTLQGLNFNSAALTIGAWSPVFQSMEIDLGNQVILRPDANSAGGYKTALITDRRVNGTLTPEMVLVATKDLHGEWLSETEQALAFSLSEGNIGFVFSLPKIQFTNLQEGENEGNQIETLEFEAHRSAAAGDDEISVTLDITP